MTFTDKVARLGGWPKSRFGGPMIIGHRGAQHHAIENTLPSFELASRLGADMWELDIRNTADGTCVISHDDDLSRVYGVEKKISELTFSELSALDGMHIPTLQEAITLAKYLGTGLYIEVKGEGSGPKALEILKTSGYPFVALGSFLPHFVSELAELNCPYPLSVLVRTGDDPFKLAALSKADIIHPCWEKASDRPDKLLTQDLLGRAEAEQLSVVVWHEERPEVIKELMNMSVLGVCTDRPELMVPYPQAPARPSEQPKGAEIVCHRGINKLAPENTLASARLAFEQGLDWVELDTHQTKDNALIVMHDEDVDRTTNGTGPIAEKTLSEIRALDTRKNHVARYQGEKVPTLEEMIDLAKNWSKKLYIEIKRADPQLVLDCVKQKDFLNDCFFWSFNWPLIEQLHVLEPQANIMARVSDFDSLEDLFACIAPFVVEIGMEKDRPDAETADLIAAIREKGAKAMLCEMGDDTEAFRRMVSLEPDMVNLDNPHIWKEVWNIRQRPESL